MDAEPTKAQGEMRSACSLRGQRCIRTAKERCEAAEHGCIMLTRIPGRSGRGQSSQEVIGAGTSAIVQQQPRRLQILDKGDALEEAPLLAL